MINDSFYPWCEVFYSDNEKVYKSRIRSISDCVRCRWFREKFRSTQFTKHFEKNEEELNMFQRTISTIGKTIYLMKELRVHFILLRRWMGKQVRYSNPYNNENPLGHGYSLLIEKQRIFDVRHKVNFRQRFVEMANHVIEKCFPTSFIFFFSSQYGLYSSEDELMGKYR